jgi:hypothetical protein
MEAVFELAAGFALMALAAGLIAAAAAALGLPPWLVAVLERTALR